MMLSVRTMIEKNAEAVFVGSFVSVAMLGFSIFLLFVYKLPETDPARLKPTSPATNAMFEKVDYSPTEVARRIPSIRLSACLFSEKVVRHYVKPALVKLPSCGSNYFHVTIAENLIDITVSGMATIENNDWPFTVVFQHNPPSVTEDGLLVTSVEVGDVVSSR